MRILQIHNRYRERGGEDTVVAAEAGLLRSAGHTVIEWQTQNPSDPLRTAASLPLAPWNPLSARRLKAIGERERPDVAHIHNTWWALSPSVVSALNQLDIPIVMTLHNYRLMCVNAQLFRDGRPCEDCVGTHPWRGVRYRCYRDSAPASAVSAATIQLNRWIRTWDSIDRFLSLTEFARQRYGQAGLPPDMIFVKPNFVADPGDRPSSPSTSNSVLYIGRLSPEKGLRQLLEAWRRAQLSDLELVVVGDGPIRGELEPNVEANVRFSGQLSQDAVKRLMLTSRALVFPSVWYEGQPMVLLEALACGLPLVVSNIGGLPETVADPEARTLAEPGHTGSWVSALEQLCDPRWVDRAGGSARSLYLERYDPIAGLAGLMRAYSEAIANRRSRRRAML